MFLISADLFLVKRIMGVQAGYYTALSKLPYYNAFTAALVPLAVFWLNYFIGVKINLVNVSMVILVLTGAAAGAYRLKGRYTLKDLLVKFKGQMQNERIYRKRNAGLNWNSLIRLSSLFFMLIYEPQFMADSVASMLTGADCS